MQAKGKKKKTLPPRLYSGSHFTLPVVPIKWDLAIATYDKVAPQSQIHPSKSESDDGKKSVLVSRQGPLLPGGK